MCSLCRNKAERVGIGNGLKTLYRDVTPSDAVKILDDHNGQNRSVKKNQVARIASDMKNGRWVSNSGEFVSFDDGGDIVSGQHRLLAVIDSGMSVGMWFVFGVQTESRIVCDGAARRSGHDALMFSGAESYTVLQAAALRIVLAYDAGFLDSAGRKASRYRVTNAQLSEHYAKHDGLEEAAKWATTHHKLLAPIPPAVAAWGYYMTHRLDAYWADQFWKDLAVGRALDEGDPRLAMMNMFRVANNRKQHAKVTGVYIFGISHAWNLWIQDKQVRSMTYYTTKEYGSTRAEEFRVVPALIEVN